MIRIPLRELEIQKESLISKRLVTIKNLQTLFKEMKQEGLMLLPFLSSIQKVSFSEVYSSGNVNNLYWCEISGKDEEFEKRKRFSEYFQRETKVTKENESHIRSSLGGQHATYSINLEDSSGNKQKWVISQRVEFLHSSEIPNVVQHAIDRKTIGTIPTGGVGVCIQDTSLVSSYKKGKVFCGLPTDITAELPVCVPANFIGKNGRNIPLEDDPTVDPDKELDCAWNKTICKEILTPCYASLQSAIRMAVFEDFLVESKGNRYVVSAT